MTEQNAAARNHDAIRKIVDYLGEEARKQRAAIEKDRDEIELCEQENMNITNFVNQLQTLPNIKTESVGDGDYNDTNVYAKRGDNVNARWHYTLGEFEELLPEEYAAHDLVESNK